MKLYKMLLRLSYIECPVCGKKVEHNRFLSGSKRSKWGLINIEIQCPLCESRLIMEDRSQQRLKIMIWIAFISSPILIAILADLIGLININSAFIDNFLLIFALTFLAYIIFAVYTVNYVQKKDTSS
jgi:DNA-directed RNA polymerase subunit RPC12/RpoP